MRKVNDGRTDDGQHVITIVHMSLLYRCTKNDIFGEIFRLKGWVTTPTSLLLNLTMKCVLFLLFCSIAAVLFLTFNLYIV